MDKDKSVLNATSFGANDDDPLVEECLRDAMCPYLGVLSPEEASDYREFLIVFMKTHPAAAPLYRRLRKRPVATQGSGDVPREGADDNIAPEPGVAGGTEGSNAEPPLVRSNGTFGRGRR